MEHVAVALLAAAVIVLLVRERSSRAAIAALRHRVAAAEADGRANTDRAAVGNLVSELARELKTPLQGVIGNAEVMLASADTAPGEELRDIHDHAARAAHIVRNLVAFSETTSLTRRWHDLNDVAVRAAAAARLEAPAAGRPITIAATDRLPLVYIDGRQLERAIAALLAHGAAAPTPQPKLQPIEVATRRTATGDDLAIDVAFPGLRKDAVEQALAAGELAACRHVIGAHGGTVTVASRGDGACVEIHLPAAVVELLPEPASGPQTGPAHGDGRKTAALHSSQESSASWTTLSTSSTSTATGTSRS